jgi:hypothetical protein
VAVRKWEDCGWGIEVECNGRSVLRCSSKGKDANDALRMIDGMNEVINAMYDAIEMAEQNHEADIYWDAIDRGCAAYRAAAKRTKSKRTKSK